MGQGLQQDPSYKSFYGSIRFGTTDRKGIRQGNICANNYLHRLHHHQSISLPVKSQSSITSSTIPISTLANLIDSLNIPLNHYSIPLFTLSELTPRHSLRQSSLTLIQPLLNSTQLLLSINHSTTHINSDHCSDSSQSHPLLRSLIISQGNLRKYFPVLYDRTFKIANRNVYTSQPVVLKVSKP